MSMVVKRCEICNDRESSYDMMCFKCKRLHSVCPSCTRSKKHEFQPKCSIFEMDNIEQYK